MYSVNYWGSKPGTNDDCATGWDDLSKEEAIKKYHEAIVSPWYYVTGIAWIELDGPDLHLERENPSYVKPKDSDDDWKREIAMESGMLGGCDAYNEAMGYD